MTQPLVSEELIEILLNQVDYEFTHLEQRVHCSAVSKTHSTRFVIVDVFINYNDPDNFDKEMGEKMALELAKKDAKNKLYIFEAWKAFCELREEESKEETTEEVVA